LDVDDFEPELRALAAIEEMMIRAIKPPHPIARLRPTCPFLVGIAMAALLDCSAGYECPSSPGGID
jgi:hypothetical protein